MSLRAAGGGGAGRVAPVALRRRSYQDEASEQGEGATSLGRFRSPACCSFPDGSLHLFQHYSSRRRR